MQTFHPQWARLSGFISLLRLRLSPRRRVTPHAAPAVANAEVLLFRREAARGARSAKSDASAQKNRPITAANLKLVEPRSSDNVAAPMALAPSRRVRVHRVGEGATERLVLVGRMSDVCAELDRLVLRERRRA